MTREQLVLLKIGDLIIITRGNNKGIIAKVVGFADKYTTWYPDPDYFNPILVRYGHVDKYSTRYGFKSEEELIAAGYKRVRYGVVLESIDPTIMFNGFDEKMMSSDRRQITVSYAICKPLSKD